MSSNPDAEVDEPFPSDRQVKADPRPERVSVGPVHGRAVSSLGHRRKRECSVDASRLLRPRAILPLSLAACLLSGMFVLAQEARPQAGTSGTAKKKQSATPGPKKEADAKAPVMPSGPIDLNSASAEDLMTVPGVGEAYARKIIEGRPYKAAADLTQAGLPAATVEKLKPRIVVRPLPTPVDVNADPALQLQTLPGVGPALAEEIIAGRPYLGYDDLAKVRGLGPSKLDALRGRLKFGAPAGATPPKAREKARANAEAPPPSTKARAEPKTRAGEPKGKMTKAAESAGTTRAPKLAPGTKININTATKDQLDTLFGIGEVKSQAIIEGRPYATIQDIKKVRGIKEGEFAKIRDLITVK